MTQPNAANRRLLRILASKTAGGMPEDLRLLRAMTDRAVTPMWLSRLPLRSVRERMIPGPGGPLRLRVYRPHGAVRGTLLFLHGGGFVHCGLDSHDGICCRLARSAGCVVASLDYRLAPEHPFPAAPEDALAALAWMGEHVAELGGGPLAVAGDSAGGNLAAVVCLMAREAGLPRPALQVLFYPATHGLTDVPSRQEFSEGFFLTTDLMRWYMAKYLDNERHATDPRFAPYLAPDLSGLPPALVLTAECDPLRDEGAQYAARLRESGTPAEHRCVPGTIHGFLNFYAFVPDGRRVLREAGRALRRALAA